MGVGRRPGFVRAVRARSRFRFGIDLEQITRFGAILLLIFGCVHTGEVEYLSAAEIRETIIDNSLKGSEPDSWKEDYFSVDDDKLEGIIQGHQRSGTPYRGAWSIDGDSMCIEYPSVPEQGGCYRFSRGNENEVFWFDEDGALSFESEWVERGAAESGALEWVSPAYRHETLTFQHGQNRVVGDLSLPTDSAPYPAVVFVHGSGPATRHMDYLKTIGNEFLRRGFATFIWSKPGVDESTGHYLKQTMEMRAEEVAAAMAHLAERSDIDGDRIGLWGISQAGWVMPMVPAYRSVAFVISVSGSAQTGQKQDLFGTANELTQIGFSDDELADALDHRLEFYDLIHEGLTYEEFLPRQQEWLAEMKARPWYPTLESNLDELIFQDFVMEADPQIYEFVSINDQNGSLVSPPRLKNLEMPVLAIYGSEDTLVDSDLGSNAYREISQINENSDVTVIIFEGADHGIMQPDGEGYLDFAPDFLTTMGEWLAEHR
jgi:pimeloyl-ACP methyl ester carboxylesterase